MNVFANSLGAWDGLSFLNNSKNYASRIFAGVVALAGLILLGIGAVNLVRKIASPEKTRTGWPMIVLSIIVGGALGLGGGWALMQSIGSGGERTIRDMGGGAVLPWL